MELDHSEFKLLQALFFQHTGISLSDRKKQLVIARLAKRVRLYQFDSFYQYYCFVKQDAAAKGCGEGELQHFIDRLTTHETSFFREPKHFEFLAHTIKADFGHNQPLSIWSGACSTGEEPYSIAMTVANHIDHNNWQIVASDISTDVLNQAKSRRFSRQDVESIPLHYRLDHCLMGTGNKQDQVKIKKTLATKIAFTQINLAKGLPIMPAFDFIFLRNVLIYFEDDIKHQIISRLAAKLKPKGYLLLGHSESLLNHPKLKQVQPTVYRLVG